MPDSTRREVAGSHLVYPRTSKEDLRKGMTVIARGEGVRIFDHWITGEEKAMGL